MKKYSKIFAVVLAVISVFMLSMTAFAADTFSITPATGDTHNYKIYQIATGDVYNGKLSNAVWGDGTNKTGEVSAADAAAFEAVADTNNTAEITAIQAIIGSLNDANAKNPGTGFVPGYYLVKDADEATGAADYPLFMVAILDSDATINRKAASAPPTATKTIVSGSSDVKGKTAKAGDDISYKVVCTLPSNLSMYSTYKYEFVDTFSSKLTYNSDLVVMQGTSNRTSAFTVSFTGGKLVATCSDIKAVIGNDATDLVFTYSAKLAADAAAENDNKVNVEYSNDPNGNGTGKSADSPNSTATVYTSTLIITSDPEGGVFELQDKDGNIITPVEPNKWTGLDDGNYTLVEKTTPDGYNTPKPIEFTIASTITPEGDRTDLTADGLPTPTISVEDGTISSTIAHTAGIQLPVTGTIGIVLLAGAAAVVTGTAFGIRAKGKKEDEEENA